MVDSITAVYRVFERHISHGLLLPYTHGSMEINRSLYDTLTFYNPVFTKADREGVNRLMREIPITDHMDPWGILRKAKGRELYLEENMVPIFKLNHNST